MPDTCTISGTLVRANGAVAAGVKLYSVSLEKTGTAVKAEYQLLATSGADGTISFALLRASSARLHGPVRIGSTDISAALGVEFAIPDAATATLEGLGAAVTVPTQGLTWKVAGVLQANLASVLDFGTGITITESPTGELNISVPVVDAETIQDALSTFFPDAAPFDWTYDDAGNRVTLTISNATAGQAGLMSSADKTKLDGVATGATANSTDAVLLARANHTGTQVLATISDAGTAASRNVAASGNAASGEVVKGDDTRLTDSRTPTGGAGGVLSGTYPNPGFAVDMATQAELDSEASARIAGDNNSQPLDSDLTAIAALSPTNDDLLQRKSGAWTNRTPAQVKTDLTLTSADVGLGNVDNTSDATKNAASVTLTNKTIALGSNTVSGTLAQLNSAVTDADVASLTGAETLSNKTLTAPNIGAATGTSITLGTNPSSTGIVALPNNTEIKFRNAANSGDLRALTLTSGNTITVGNSGAALSLSDLWTVDQGTGAIRNGATYPVHWNNQGVAIAGVSSGLAEINNGTNGTFRDLKVRQHYVDATMTVAGTTGAQTINKGAGSVNFAAGASSLVVTNNLVTTTSIVLATIQTDDATAVSVKAIPAAGSFTLKLNAAATAETKVAFLVVNK